jgi:hypothetical protein
MAIEVIKVDSIQTRLMQSFVNLTQLNSTRYPATTSMQIQYSDTGTAMTTAYFVYDQYAFRTTAVSGLALP